MTLTLSSITGKSAAKYGGGNPTCTRPTPDWQKGIGMFLSPSKSTDKENTEPDNDDVEVTEEVTNAG